MKYKSDGLFLIVIHGPMGAGKTAVADLLHDEIENMAHFGVDHIKWLISDGKTNPERKKISQQMVMVMAEKYLSLGTSVLVEQAFSGSEIDELKNIASTYKAEFLVYNLEASRQIMNERIKERTERLGKPEVSEDHIEKSYNDYIGNKYTEGAVLNSEEMTVREVADKILKDLSLI